MFSVLLAEYSNCFKAAKAIFMGPSADLEADGYHKGRPGNASIIGLDTFTPRIISGVVTQASRSSNRRI